MAKKKKTVKRKRIKKSRLLILVFLLLAIIFSIMFGLKMLAGSTSEDKTKTDSKSNETKTQDNTEIEHLSLDEDKSKGKIKILIDPGHGGNDAGAKGVDGSLEKNISLEISKKVAGDLSQYEDLEVILTRTEDTYVSLEERSKMANEQGVNMVVSIHLNSESGGRSASGTETYYQSNNIDGSEKLAKSIQDTICLYLDTKNRGIYPSNLEILRETEMPSVLVEAGFISNKEEEKKLSDSSYQNQMAEGIAQGILRYIDSKHK